MQVTFAQTSTAPTVAYLYSRFATHHHTTVYLHALYGEFRPDWTSHVDIVVTAVKRLLTGSRIVLAQQIPIFIQDSTTNNRVSP